MLNYDFSSLQDVGFSKEYEEIRADSCLDEYAAQDAQHPQNQEKNRYPNIVACKLDDILSLIELACLGGAFSRGGGETKRPSACVTNPINASTRVEHKN